MVSGSHLRIVPKQLLMKTTQHTEHGKLTLLNLGGGSMGSSCLPFTVTMGYFGNVNMFAHARLAAGMFILV